MDDRRAFLEKQRKIKNNSDKYAMTTIKQIITTQKLVENGGNVTKAMRESGYSESSVNNPSNLTGSKGYKQILADCGLTESFIVNALVSDIIKKPEKRLGELTLASDLLGLRKKSLVVEDKLEENQTPERREEIEDYSRVFNEYLDAKLRDKDSITIDVRR